MILVRWSSRCAARGKRWAMLPAGVSVHAARVTASTPWAPWREDRAGVELSDDLARAYGIEGFCYWHYWFAGKRLLELPINQVMASAKPDFPFCLGWANESWTGIWHGNPDRILIEQSYPGVGAGDRLPWLPDALGKTLQVIQYHEAADAHALCHQLPQVFQVGNLLAVIA